MPTSRNSVPAKNPMKPSDASRIQSTQAKAGNNTGRNSLAARSQSAAANNVNRGVVNPGGGSTGNSGIPKATTASGKTLGGTSRK
ncbi:hypothetical protein Ac2012v2_006836 [Leucoagaricus gongylophorus]